MVLPILSVTAKLSKHHAVHPIMLLPRSSTGCSMVERRLTFGVVGLFCMLWSVEAYHSKTRSRTSNSESVNTRCQRDWTLSSKTLSTACYSPIRSNAYPYRKSETTSGSNTTSQTTCVRNSLPKKSRFRLILKLSTNCLRSI